MVTSATLQQQQKAAERKLAVKNDILLPVKSQKLERANDKNSERKLLLGTLGIGMNLLEIGPEVTSIEFVVNSLKILTNYSHLEETFECE